jgi:hypothetical protein
LSPLTRAISCLCSARSCLLLRSGETPRATAVPIECLIDKGTCYTQAGGEAHVS